MGSEPVTFGQYELVRRIARGGMAEIFLAIERGMGGIEREVVVKRILPQMSEEEDFVTMFMDEARVVARLTHPNIAHIYEFGEIDGVYYLAMERVDGLTVSRLRRWTEPELLPLPHALRIAADVCAGLHAAHETRDSAGALLGVVHRDVSPQNVMISRDGVTKLIDFGVARAATQAHATRAGQIKGKLGYIPPEQYRGEAIDRRADVFGVGAVLYEMVTGTRAFVRDNEAATMHAVLLDDPRPIPPELAVPPELDVIIRRAVAKDPLGRYPTALEMQGDLEQLAVNAGAVVTPFILGRFVQERLDRAATAKRPTADLSGLGSAPSDPAADPFPAGPTTPFIRPERPAQTPPEPDDDAETIVSDSSYGSQPSFGSQPSVNSQPSVTSAPGSIPPSMTTPGPASDVAPPRAGRRAMLGVIIALVALFLGFGTAGVFWLVTSGAPEPAGAVTTAPRLREGPSPVPTPTPAPMLAPHVDAAALAPTVPAATTAGSDAAPPATDLAATADAAPAGTKVVVATPPEPPEAAPERHTGRLYLRTSPWSKVRAGRRSLGTTPLMGVELPAGSHLLEMQDAEGNTTRRRVRIRPGASTKLFIDLRAGE